MEIWNGIKCRMSSWWDAMASWGTGLIQDAPSVQEIQTVRPLVCIRTACIVVSIGGIMQAQAAISYVNTSSGINPTDTISWAKRGFDGAVVFNPASGNSSNGLRFLAAKPSSGAMRLSIERVGGQDELCLNTQNSGVVSIEFEHAVAAAGAEVVMSTPAYGKVTVRAYDSMGSLIMQTTETHTPGKLGNIRYMGAVATNENIKTLEYSTDAGVISLGHVDLRPFNAAEAFPADLSSYYAKAMGATAIPRVSDHLFSVLKNSNFLSPEPNVLSDSVRTESVKLVKGPEHAANFALHPDGKFDYTPAKDFHGRDEFVFTGTNDFGQNQSAPARVQIDVIWANSPPTFKAGTDLVSEEDAGLQVIKNWATDISAGASDEDNIQNLTWIVDNDNTDLFVEQPKVDMKGNLTYKAAPKMFGTAHLTIWLKDDGGTYNGGVDTSKPAHVTLDIQPTEHKPVLDPISEQTVRTGEMLSLQVAGSTPDYGKPIIYTMTNAPEGMTINNLTGEIRWIPGSEAAGKTYAVNVYATTSRTPETTDSKIMKVSVPEILTLKTITSPLNLLAVAKAPVLIFRKAAMPIMGLRTVPSRTVAIHHSRYWVD